MKNFPNQASDFSRLRATLQTIKELGATGSDVLDDGVLGYGLARRQQYTFRNFDYDRPDAAAALEERIAAESLKPASNQGARTNAREMRRTLRALGWLSDQGALTPEGEALLASAPGSWEERSLLAAGLLDLEVTDDSGTSHPVRIMLELLAVAPSVHRDGLELALEADNDSAGELARVKRLYAMPAAERHAELGATKVQIDNAVKIFPTLAKTAGLVIEEAGGVLQLSPDGADVVGAPPAEARRRVRSPRGARRARTRREVTSTTVAAAGGAQAPAVPLTPEQQARADQLRRERTDRHQALVRATASRIVVPGQMYEDPYSYDLLFVPDDASLPIVLFEMKTIDDDAASQVRLAVGQLSYYHYFEVSPEWPDRAVVEIAVVDGDIGEALSGYLAAEEIGGVLVGDGGASALNDVEDDVLRALGVL